VGMTFIAGVFPVAIHFTMIATERTIAAIAADEAFAKIRIYAIGDLIDDIDDIDPNELEENSLTAFDCPDVFLTTVNIDPCEFAYPSDPDINISRKQYFWSALCRRTDTLSSNVQVTVFVSRRTSSNLQYYQPEDICDGEVDWETPDTSDRPVPVRLEVSDGGSDNELRIENTIDGRTFIKDGYTIVDDATGRIYRVLERYPPPDEEDTILLDRDWDDDIGSPEYVWVVPPPVGSGRYPCIEIYQKVIRF